MRLCLEVFMENISIKNWARLKNRNTPISITVAAKQRKMMHLAAKHADIWESSYLSPEQFVSLNSEFEKISNPTTKTYVKSHFTSNTHSLLSNGVPISVPAFFLRLTVELPVIEFDETLHDIVSYA